MWIAVIVLSILVLVPLVGFIVGALLSAPRYRGPVSDHFNGKAFVNPGRVKAKGGMDVLKWMITRKRGPWHEKHDETFGKHPLGHFKGGLRVTYINHATFLIQLDGVNILTDPVWSKRVSPFKWIGPKRMSPPGIQFGDLPRIHAVLLTHNHYDHLDIETMRMVFTAHHPQIIAPLGLKKFLDQNYIRGCAELDWWQEMQVNDLVIESLPAQHFSGRGLLDRDATLWCGYAVKSRAGNIYFAGDTGYNDKTFREIGARSGPFRVSILPIGAYKPEWFMSPIHVSPEDAVRIHLDVKSQNSIAMHFGTFPLADEGEREPVEDLRVALKKRGIDGQEFITLKPGEVRVFE
ncbi:MAG TPA: MBL fold metallo-hydrolase [Chryseosolibacter sp.]|nr:MBL fold metallo-hydrolase [Chryseosolibacter sp.]